MSKLRESDIELINKLINSGDYDELKRNSFLGSTINEVCKESNEYDSDIATNIKSEVIRLYFSELANNFANPKVYYFIVVADECVSLSRDIKKSPRNYPIKSKKLESMINNDYISFTGEDILNAINEEKELNHDGLAANKPMKVFIDEVINNRKYCPKKDIYYWFKFNSSGRYFLKRDLVLSPKMKRQ